MVAEFSGCPVYRKSHKHYISLTASFQKKIARLVADRADVLFTQPCQTSMFSTELTQVTSPAQ